jgi:hypothetical protein
MSDSYVELQDIPVMRVRADMKGKGPSAAMNLLESKLPTLKGRKFYGIFRETPDGEEYYACVAEVETDNPSKMQLETGVISWRKVRQAKGSGLGEGNPRGSTTKAVSRDGSSPCS